MPEPEETIHRLLRQRGRVEPPPDFLDGFISDFHRRQRQEMLSTPAWKLAWERFTAGFGADYQVPRMAYAGAFITFLAAVVITVAAPGSRHAAPHLAQSAIAEPPASITLGPGEVLVALPATALPSLATTPSSLRPVQAVPPRYVLDARPVSYEPPFSF